MHPRLSPGGAALWSARVPATARRGIPLLPAVPGNSGGCVPPQGPGREKQQQTPRHSLSSPRSPPATRRPAPSARLWVPAASGEQGTWEARPWTQPDPSPARLRAHLAPGGRALGTGAAAAATAHAGSAPASPSPAEPLRNPRRRPGGSAAPHNYGSRTTCAGRPRTDMAGPLGPLRPPSPSRWRSFPGALAGARGLRRTGARGWAGGSPARLAVPGPEGVPLAVLSCL